MPRGGREGPLTITVNDVNSKTAELLLPIDALALVHLDLPLEEVGVVLREAVMCQLLSVAKTMLWKVRIYL